MARLQLDMLPMEVLQAVSHSLDASHEPSVANLSLVNRTCRRAAAPAYFRDLVLHVSAPQRLAEDIGKWYQILQANDSFRYVRYVEVTGDIHRHARVRWSRIDTDTSASMPESFETDEPWMPLARFIEKLSGLRDMHFHYHTTFPSCLLASLRRDSLSTCRLRITNFRLSSLRNRGFVEDPQPLVLIPEDLATLRSSNLHAISLSTWSAWSQHDYHPDAIFDIVSRACPKLHEVEFVQIRVKGPLRRRIKRPYPGLRLDQVLDPSIRPAGSKAGLTSLSLRGRQPQLQRWQQHTDFTVLRTLKMTGYREADILNWATHAAHFPALSCLEIQTPETDASSLTTFLASLPGLQDLTILGAMDDSTMIIIKQNHGSTLQHLSLPGWACSSDGLISLQGACPHLSSLAVKVPRTQGDATEVAIYTAFGTYSKLQSLKLNLDCAIHMGNEPRAGTNARTPTSQRLFINCAIDSQLAASIYDKISSARPAGSPPLPHLQLNVVNAGVVVSAQGTTSGMQEANRARVYDHFTRKWICNVHPGDDWQGGVVVTEQEASKRSRERNEVFGAQPLTLGELEEVFRQLWPGVGGDWRDEWRSFGLAD